MSVLVICLRFASLSLFLQCNIFKTFLLILKHSCFCNKVDFFEISELSVVMCRTPGNPAQGFVEGDDFKYGSQVSFKCNTGYTLKGSQVAYCQLNGSWSAHHPECGKNSLCFFYCNFFLKKIPELAKKIKSKNVFRS